MDDKTQPNLQDSALVFVEDNLSKNELFRINPDGTVVRGPAFTTVDEMSLAFWDAVERHACTTR